VSTVLRDPSEDLRSFASVWGLDFEALANEDISAPYCIEREGDAPFDGNPHALQVFALGRFGNRFYQLLNATMIARRLGCREIRLDGPVADVVGLPRLIRGIRFVQGDDHPIDRAVLRGIFISYRGFDRLIEPLDPWFIRDTIDNLIMPLFWPPTRRSLGEHVIVLHFRAGDVFSGAGTWVPSHYVMPPASFYTGAVEYARARLGVTEVRIVYEDRGNPAIAAVEDYLGRAAIPFISQSGTLRQDSSTMRAAAHLVIPYGSLGEAIALMSTRLRSLFSFRQTESHDWLYRRPQSLLEVVLQRAKGVRTFVTADRGGGYIPPFGWEATAEQLALIRDYPSEALEIRETVLPEP
jgi:hypothetical protein